MLSKNNIHYINNFVIFLFLLSKMIFAASMDQINIGYTGKLTGKYSLDNASYINGALAFFNNSDFRQYNLLIKNTHDTDSQTFNTVNFLKSNQVNFLFGYQENASFLSILPLLSIHNMDLFFPLGASDALYKYSKNTHVFMNRMSYESEIRHLVDFISHNNYKNIAVIYELGYVGVQLKHSLSSVLMQHNKSINLSSGYYIDDPAIHDSSYYSIFFQDQDINLVIIFANSEISSSFIRSIRSSGFDEDIALISLTNFNHVSELLKNDKRSYKNLIFSDIFDFNTNYLYFYNEFMDNFSSPYNSLSYRGYISAKLLDIYHRFKYNQFNSDPDNFIRFKQYLKSKNEYQYYFSEQFYLIRVDNNGNLREVFNAE